MQDLGVTGVGVEPVPLHLERAREAIAAAGLADRITLHQGGVEDVAGLDDGRDAEMLHRHLGNVPENLDRRHVESAFERAGLRIGRTVEIGTEWREHAEERTQPVSRELLRLARLRRQRVAVVADHGQDVYDHVEANLHWELFQLLGKLEPVVFVFSGV